MKKLLIVLAFAGVSMASMAQDAADPTLKYSVATNSFWSNWFIQVNGGWEAWYSSEEHGAGLERSPFKGFRSNPRVSLAIGKWFTPGIGLRTKLSGIWGKTVYADAQGNAVGRGNKYWDLNEHVLFNLSNLLFGYNPKRVWNFIPFAGGGFGRTMTHNLYAMDLSVGLLNEFRVSKHVAINLELGWNRFESDIDGGYDYYGNRGWDSHDNNLYGELGLTFNLGKSTWEKVPDVDAIKALSQSQIDALNAQLNDANAENARLKNMLANQKPAGETKTVKEFVTAPVSVYFYINKTNNGPSYKRDLVDVKSLVDVAKQKDASVLVTGYADSATGKSAHNKWLSDKRAEQVANEIVKMGLSRDKIETVGKGGVSILSPINLDRRATVEIK